MLDRTSTEHRTSAEHRHTTDAQQLASLGYTSEFRRDMSLWANFSLGFTYLSPVVGVYTLFAVSLAAGGPPMIWSFAVAGVGQLLVALIFSEIVSQYPLAGGVYPWARRLWGRKWGWMTGWVYLLALLATISSVAYGSGPYVAALFGFEPGTSSTICCALGLLVLATAINLGGTKVLSLAAMFGFVAEILGAIAVGGWLLLTHRVHGIGVLFDSFGTAGDGSYLAAFLAAGLIGVFQYYGFEACADVAEEVSDPGRRIPKAMRRTIYVGGAAAMGVCLALILAVGDFGAVISGQDADPVTTVLNRAFGPVGTRFVLAVVLISFVSCALSLQAAASRLTYSFARDRMIAGSRLLSRFSARLRVPPYALLLAGIAPAAIIGLSALSEDALTKIISFSTLGIYLTFQMVVLAALQARLKGWRPAGSYRLGRWGPIVNVLALVYGVSAIVNIVWPRTPQAPWYDNYVVLLGGVLVIATGSLYLLLARPHRTAAAADGDDSDTAPAGAPAPSSEAPSAAGLRDEHT